MNNGISIEGLDLRNAMFWEFIFSNSYQYYDEDEDLSMGDILGEDEGFQEAVTASLDWYQPLRKYGPEVFEESDGQVEDPVIISVRLKADKVFKMEVHPGDVYCYLDDEMIGVYGPHFMLYCFQWQELQKIVENNNNSDILFHLLLPLTLVSPEEVPAAKKEFRNRITALQLNLKPETIEVMAEGLVDSITSEEPFQMSEIGIVSNEINSLRRINYHKDNVERVKRINAYIDEIT